MSDSLDPRDDLTDRLAALGRTPVAPSLQSQHLTAMASVRAERSFRSALVGRLKVGAGVFAGFLLGASGLTMVGGMGPLQPIAADVIETVAPVDAPKGAKAEKAAKVKAEKASKGEGASNKIWGAANGCPGATEYRNRGAFLKAAKDAERDGPDGAKAMMSFEAARQSDCGKGAGDGTDDDTTDTPKTPEVEEPKDDVEGAENGKADEANGKKGEAPGQEGKEKGEPGSKAQGPKEGEGTENKPEDTPAGPPAEPGKSDVQPPAEVDPPPADPPTDTPAGDNTPGEATPEV